MFAVVTCEHYEYSSRLFVMEVSADFEPPSVAVDINDLPDEIIVEILSHSTFEELTEVMQNVCSRWRRLSQDRELWLDKIFRIYWRYSDDEAVARLQLMPQLRSLAVQRDVGPSVVDALCDHCRHLTSLEFAYPQQLIMLEKVVENCRNIQSLTIPHRQLCDERNARALAELRHLRSLEIRSHAGKDGPIHLRPLAEGCPELARLKLCEHINVSVEDLEYLFSMKHKTLTHITMYWASYDRCLVPPLKVCSSLVSLDLHDCTALQDQSPDAFTAVGQLSNLRTLSVRTLEWCPPEVAAAAFRSGGLSRLRVLYMVDSHDLRDSVVVAICVGCRELRELYLGGCIRLTDEALGQLHLLQDLETLYLNDCMALRGESLRRVARLPKLRDLSLASLEMTHLQPGLECVLDIASLESLSFDDARDMDVFPFDRLPGKLVNLRLLHLDQCRLDKSVVERLQEQMPHLEIHFFFLGGEAWVSEAEDIEFE